MSAGSSLTSRPSTLSLGTPTSTSQTPRQPERQETPQILICGLHQKIQQRWRSPIFFLVMFCLVLLLQSSVYSYLRGTDAAITRHTALSSKHLLYLTASAEIAWILLSIPLINHCSKKNGPQWMTIASCIFLMGVMCFVSIAFIPIDKSLNASDGTRYPFCGTSADDDILEFSARLKKTSKDALVYTLKDGASSSSTQIFIALWWLGSAFTSVGNWLLTALGAAYLDNSVKKDTSIIYVATAIALRLGGVLLGSAMAAFQNHLHIQSSSMDDGFGGSWWLILLISCFPLVVSTVILSLFPKHIVEPKPRPVFHLQTEDGDISAIEIGAETPSKVTWGHSVYTYYHDLYELLAEILSKKALLWTLAGDVLAFTGSFGLLMWLPKYLEGHFRVDRSDSSVYTGISCTSSVIVGVLGGALAMRQCKPSSKSVVLAMATSKVVYALIILAMVFLTCEFDADLPGTLHLQSGMVNPNFDCASDCQCASASVTPVCLLGDGIRQSFLTPCHAGCPLQEGLPDFSSLPLYLYNCSCAKAFSYVQRGYCSTTCTQFTVYNMLNVLVNSLVSVGLLASTLVNLRSTNREQKAMGMTLKLLSVSAAFVMSQLLYQLMEDWSCLVSKDGSSPRFQDCLIHDSTILGYKIHGLTSMLYLLSSLCDLMVSFNTEALRLMNRPRSRPRRRSSQSDVSNEHHNETISVKSLRQALLRHLSAPSAHQAHRTRQ